jgi:hypothetical protein
MQQEVDNKDKRFSSFTPFFVADRQASLKILSGIVPSDGKKFGLMTHANTHKNFRAMFKKFPCVNPEECAVIGNKKCPYEQNLSRCELGKKIKDNLVTICDSGVFTKEGCTFSSYEELFGIYEILGVDFGIMIDYLKDKEQTLKSAKEAIKIYRSKEWNFNLMGVAQGVTKEDYIECYLGLKEMGYKYIGIGGMLKKKENSARYVHIRDEFLLEDILSSIRSIDQDGMIFALGCYSPKRQEIFTRYSVFGSDYKGWIFQYNVRSKKRGDKRAQTVRFRQVRDFINYEVLSRSQNWLNRNRLLVVSCSKTKREVDGLIPAIYLYDGPVYRLLRKRITDFTNENGFDIKILSAKYGLIDPLTPIQNYDQIMTKERAEELKYSVSKEFSQLLSKKNYNDILINLGVNYMLAFEQSLTAIPETTSVNVLKGPIGKRLQLTKRWIDVIQSNDI